MALSTLTGHPQTVIRALVNFCREPRRALYKLYFSASYHFPLLFSGSFWTGLQRSGWLAFLGNIVKELRTEKELVGSRTQDKCSLFKKKWPINTQFSPLVLTKNYCGFRVCGPC